MTVQLVGRVVGRLGLAAALVAAGYLGARSTGHRATERQVIAAPPLALARRTLDVERGTVRSGLLLRGVVAPDAPVATRAPVEGKVVSLAPDGGSVAAGAEVAVIEVVETAPPTGDGPPPPAKRKRLSVKAPAEGTVRHGDVAALQQVAAGTAVVDVLPPTFHLDAALVPNQLYRFAETPKTVTVAIVDGPPPFPCPVVGLLPGSAASEPGGEASGQVTLRCAVPRDVRVFPGVAADVTLDLGIATNVLVVPVTAVIGRSGSGIVEVKTPTGVERRTVELGLTDGAWVEVRSGLQEGERIVDLPEQATRSG